MQAPAKTSWRTHPESVEAFQKLDRMLPTAPVLRGPVERRLSSAPLDFSGFGFRMENGPRIGWEQFLQATHTDGFIIVRESSILFEHHANGMTPASRHMAFSVTKSVVGLLAEILAGEGALSLTEPAEILLPELRGTAFGASSLESLLAMRDGVAFDENYADPNAAIHRYSQAYWGSAPGGTRAMLASLPPAGCTPGAFAYRTPPADVVGWALERATAAPLETLVSTRIWQPMGASEDAYFVRDTGGDAIAGAGLNCTLQDLARIGLFLLDAAPDAARARIFAGGSRGAFAASDQPTRQGYSYQSFWWNSHAVRPAVMALGVYGQRLVVEPGTGTVMARFGSHPVASNAATDALHAAAFDALAEFLAAA